MSFIVSIYLLTKIFPKNIGYTAINLNGSKFCAGSLAIIEFLEKCEKKDPNVKFDLIKVETERYLKDIYPIMYQIKPISKIIEKIIEKKIGVDIDLSPDSQEEK